MENNQKKSIALTKIKLFREKHLPYNEHTLRRLAISASIMFVWLFIWALVFKLGRVDLLERNYNNLIEMTLMERIMWDIIPFNYRGTEYMKFLQVVVTVLNCFIFAPFGVTFQYIFKKQNVLRDALICFGFSLSVEVIQTLTILGNGATEDLITNVAGYFIGLGIYFLIFKRLSAKHNVRIFAAFNVIFAITTVFSFVSTAMASEIIFKIVTRTL